MSDYMAQKADEQIEAGLSERDQLLQRIEELEKRNKAQVELTAEFDDQIGELQDKLTATTQALDAAVEALDRISNRRVHYFSDILEGDITSAPEMKMPEEAIIASDALAKIKALRGGE